MLGIGLTELILILIAALIFIGPEKLPGLARALGKAYAQFKRASDEIRRDIASSAMPPEGPEKTIKDNAGEKSGGGKAEKG